MVIIIHCLTVMAGIAKRIILFTSYVIGLSFSSLIFATLISKFSSFILYESDFDSSGLFFQFSIRLSLFIATAYSSLLPIFLGRADAIGKSAGVLTALIIGAFTIFANLTELSLEGREGIFLAINCGVWGGMIVAVVLYYANFRMPKK